MWPSRSPGSTSRLAVSPEWDSPQGLLLHTSLPSTGRHRGTQRGGRRRLAWGPASTPGAGGGLPRGLGGALRLWEELGSQGTTSVHKPQLWFQVLSPPSHKERNVGVVKAGGSPGNARTQRRVQHTARQAGGKQETLAPSTLFKPSQTATENSRHGAPRHADPHTVTAWTGGRHSPPRQGPLTCRFSH